MSTIIEPSSPSATPAPPRPREGGGDEHELSSTPSLPSLRSGVEGSEPEWHELDWAGWTRNDWRGWPDWVRGFRPHQLDAIEEIVDAYRRGADVVFLDAPTGCLSGDTEVTVNRAGKGFRITMLELFEKLHGRRDVGKAWDLSIPTYVAQGDLDEGIVRSSLMKDITLSGLKDTVVIRTRHHHVRLTRCHRVMTDGGWVRAGELQVGDRILANTGKRDGRRRKPKQHYPRVGGLIGHPRASMPGHPKAGWTVPRHILVVEADMNGVEYDHYIERLRAGDNDFIFIGESVHVHHIDHDPSNYERSNLAVMEATEHLRHHGEYSHVADQLGYEPIVAVTDGGQCLTFDIEMAEGGPHFMANGVYVHNSGKTLMGEMVRRLVGTKALYVCHSLGLQDQMLADFPYANVLKGRGNYPTQIAPFPEVTCADCTLTTRPEAEDAECTWCSEPAMCSYIEARGKALESAIAVTNTAYLLAEANNVGRLLGDRDLVIVDEADTLEQILMGTAEFRLSAGLMRRCKVEAPKKGSHGTTIGKWMMQELRPALKVLRAKIGPSDDVEKIRERARITRLLGRVEEVAREIQGDGWVRDYDKTDSLILKPVKVDTVGHDWVWKHAERWLLMSATLVSTDEMVESLGMAGLKVETVTVPMTFPVENRPIHALPVAEMTAKNKDEAWPKMAEAVLNVQAKHPDDKILVHTVSYDLAKYLAREARGEGRQVYTYAGSQFREAQVEAFKRETRPAIMFAPSLDRGFDFKGDEARVVVVAKVPYLYLGDQQVSARLRTRGGRNWYSVNTIRTLIQMTGRGVRSAEDSCTTYILDASFYKLLKGNKHLFPRWWRDGLDTTTTRRELGI